MTIDSDADVEQPSTLKAKRDQLDEASLDPDFVFDAAADPFVDFSTPISVEDLVKAGSKPV